MRYPAAETAEKHERILEQAARLFRERGFSGVSLGEIMKATGLTHGPFYNHFASKEELMAESMRHTSQKALSKLETIEPSEEGKNSFINSYLSPSHRDTPGDGCLIAALAPEISREPGVREPLTCHLSAFIDQMAMQFPWPEDKSARQQAIQTIASMVGGLVIARAVADETLSQEILSDVLAGLTGSSSPQQG
ncbi:TetR/AcrR family transcriptional regulator [Phyllobacterium sp. 628]|uniref:TetR/AcrR family transcriptional regulator n=1 Tax=Phyllobacterium sp. 628 TaxID=2718938 RepID=UPI0016626E98|nr:TetR/AcrR family transcriptional regulator [Phyllobacterium sp. 628]QND52178.1 TetR/AcrR family transcriptional regulator [Phyllobacterium sp. 628]